MEFANALCDHFNIHVNDRARVLDFVKGHIKYCNCYSDCDNRDTNIIAGIICNYHKYNKLGCPLLLHLFPPSI